MHVAVGSYVNAQSMFGLVRPAAREAGRKYLVASQLVYMVVLRRPPYFANSSKRLCSYDLVGVASLGLAGKGPTSPMSTTVSRITSGSRLLRRSRTIGLKKRPAEQGTVGNRIGGLWFKFVFTTLVAMVNRVGGPSLLNRCHMPRS